MDILNSAYKPQKRKADQSNDKKKKKKSRNDVI